MWIGTFRDPMSTVGTDGLVHFDGTEWVTYTTENSILLRDRISTLDINGDGRKWVMSDGIVEIDGATWTLYERSTIPPLSSLVVSKLHAEADELFVISSQQGLVQFSGNKWRHYHTGNSGLPDNRVNAVAINSIDEIYVATASGLAIFTE
jgi:ligand-binding sensor domain-containing protein